MIWAETTTTANPIAVWSILSSLAGGLLVFVLVRLAIRLSHGGEIEAYAKRIADLNPRCIKLQVRIENGQSDPTVLSDLSLYAREDGHLVKAASLAETPLLRQGELNFIQGHGESSALRCSPHSKNEAVLEFKLPTAYDSVFLVYTDTKDHKRKAKVNLGGAGEQFLVFHRF